MNKAWVVTVSYNQYDQEGDYFVSLFFEKPSFKQLKLLLPSESNETIGRLTRGGGRNKSHDEVWFNLIEVQEGEHCHPNLDI